jgi:ATP-binding cassette subfamily B protein
MESQKIIAPASAVLRRYIPATLTHPWLFAGVLLSTLGIELGHLATPLFMRSFFNALAQPPGLIAHDLFIKIIVSVGFISFFSWSMRRIRGFSQVYLESSVMSKLSADAFEYLLHHSNHFFSSQFSGTLTRRVAKYKDAFEALFDAFTLTLIPLVIFLGGATVVFFARNHTLGALFAMWCVLMILFQIKVTHMRQPLRERRALADSAMVGAIADAVGNQNTIALFSATGFEGNRFGEFVQRWREASLISWTADEYIWAAQGLFMIAINIGFLYGAYYFWQRGELQIGDFVLIQSYLIVTFDQIIGVNRELRRVYDAFADAGEMVAILDTPLGISDTKSAAELTVSKREVQFQNVAFYFHQERSILSDFNLSIPGGQKVALVGPSGAGKSTITKLLLRLYDVTGGEIMIDGQDIRSVTQESLRNAIGFVPQEPVLFHRTLMENIRYGKRDATDDEVIEAAKKAHCHEFISTLPDAYNTLVGERGVKLSGGERQRVAIAWAILKDAPILVLDEATSSLDSESESYIQDSLKTLMQGKTVVVIAHRLSTIMNMDRIVVLDGGTIVADGTHDELLERGGLYQKLWSIQAGGFIVDEEEKISEATP